MDFKENLISFCMGGFLGAIMALSNPVIQESLSDSKEVIIVPKKEIVRISEPPIYEVKVLSKQISHELTREELAEEIELVAQLVQAEAGNQSLLGKRLVTDVVLNRVDHEDFPNTVEEVIFQKDPVQFSVTANGAFEKAEGQIDEETYQAVLMEYENRTNNSILYFATTPCNGEDHFQHEDHWFGY